MRTVMLEQNMVYHGNLILVNRRYPCQANALDRPLITVESNILLNSGAAAIYGRIMDELNGWNRITAVSGWRGRREQEQIYHDSFLKNGAEFTGKYVALPGHSEHQTGLAIDLALNQENIDFLCPHFPYDGICGRFRRMAARFGFVERYPRDKEGITGIAHEPWHFRYVGAPHSELMCEHNLTLEEYHDLLRGHTREKPLAQTTASGKTEIFYVRAEKDATAIEMNGDEPFMISGDNVGGYIVTLWKTL